MAKTKVKDLMEFLESIAPFDLQESYDNSGHLVGDPNMEIQGVLCCLDCTEAIVDEAISRGCNVVVAHHPIIFGGVRRLTGSTYIERTVVKAIKNDMAIIAIHTNLDNVLTNGVNEKIASRLELEDVNILAPKASNHTDYETGAGVIGYLRASMNAEDFLQYLKDKMEVSVIKYTDLVREQVRKIAICGGSGRFLLDRAIEEESDVFVSADFKYHDYFDANNQIIIADIGHYESEKFTIELLYELINENFSKFAAHYSNHNTNPVKYL
jgi:dinuclear metal center YbgI/SA1388 family protein